MFSSCLHGSLCWVKTYLRHGFDDPFGPSPWENYLPNQKKNTGVGLSSHFLCSWLFYFIFFNLSRDMKLNNLQLWTEIALSVILCYSHVLWKKGVQRHSHCSHVHVWLWSDYDIKAVVMKLPKQIRLVYLYLQIIEIEVIYGCYIIDWCLLLLFPNCWAHFCRFKGS